MQSDSLRATVLGGSPTRIAALAVIREDFGPAIAGVRAPAWILWGSNDAIASPRMGLVLQARLPAARLVVLEGSGHAESPINQRYLHGVYEFDIGAEL